MFLTGKEMQYFQSFGAHEAAHVDALTSALSAAGADPVQPLDSYNFPAFNNRGDILNFARTAEELGVGAYQGAAPAIANADYLAAAGGIVQVEARHAAIVRILVGAAPAPGGGDLELECRPGPPNGQPDSGSIDSFMKGRCNDEYQRTKFE
ncbi:MAG: ferritin-like domain-containing protein [Caldilineaceae bacterium]